MSFHPEDITGLILAGGQGSRMGGVDKGLQNHGGLPLVLHALQRLAPQVGSVMINANRNFGAYEAFGAIVVPDSVPDHPGPLAGFLAGLNHCQTGYMVTVPCDSPSFPLDLVEKLANAMENTGAPIAMAATPGPGGHVQREPVFTLMRADVLESLTTFVREGGRKIDRWTDSLGAVEVLFENAGSFHNINTLEELRALSAAANSAHQLP